MAVKVLGLSGFPMKCFFLVAIDVGKAIGEVVGIDWRDRDGSWIDYIRIKVKIDILRPFQRVVHLVGSDGTETVCAIKMAGCLAVSLEGRKGGLAILWKDSVDVKLRATMDELRDVLEELTLMDIKTDKGWFTWVNNRQKPREDIKDVRLFFKFDVCWVKESVAKDIIKKAWARSGTNIIEKIEKVREELGSWQHDWYIKMINRICRLVTRIDKLIDGIYEESNAKRLKAALLKLGTFMSKRRVIGCKDCVFDGSKKGIEMPAFFIFW
ncbi:hypothetical protein J1N35_014523 [Gossypium stocksii]|uniref:Uncharacterized protein n=1 Tax=Gossypium stocksii TaxID=47602 RepID=A0A9D3VV44_9ROSI|nr:hypothetical protein J1N35_014523 [Gossypium stocksii]